ncbi:hypothetical protein NE237_019353 [Protea cynaroides]|uniref:Uncharacterized protein n=1 Tax=Protea cynaroides TaxID=273540 RepID=A0A9Q0KBQ4_9MAGN|nr:hypothetical protein NE237_019353 [Protea cynaroides]
MIPQSGIRAKFERGAMARPDISKVLADKGVTLEARLDRLETTMANGDKKITECFDSVETLEGAMNIALDGVKEDFIRVVDLLREEIDNLRVVNEDLKAKITVLERASQKKHSPKQARWQDFLVEFDMVLEYQPGRINQLADGLSRKAEFASLKLEQLASISQLRMSLPDRIREGLEKVSMTRSLVDLAREGKTCRFWLDEGLLKAKGGRLYVPKWDNLRNKSNNSMMSKMAKELVEDDEGIGGGGLSQSCGLTSL